MPTTPVDSYRLRQYRNSRVYRSLGRLLRTYNRRLIEELHVRGFHDFSAAFPTLLSNLDTTGSHIGTLARRAGVTRQAAGQLIREIERCGYAERTDSPHDSRATLVRFTPRGRRLLANVLEIVDALDREFASVIGAGEFERLRDGLFRVAEGVDPGGALEKDA